MKSVALYLKIVAVILLVISGILSGDILFNPHFANYGNGVWFIVFYPIVGFLLAIVMIRFADRSGKIMLSVAVLFFTILFTLPILLMAITILLLGQIPE